MGIRPYRCFLCWTIWSGRERGEGVEDLIARVELLPTPKVEGLDAVAHRFFSGGVLPVGSVQVNRISALFTQDQLTGLAVPREGVDPARLTPPRIESARALARPNVNTLPDPIDFFWEVVEDGRGDDPAARNKFRLAAWPWRKPGNVEWSVILERVSNDENRDGTLNSGFDPA